MSNDIGRVYSFIQSQGEDWRKDADVNNDGILTKVEMINYLMDGISWTGEDSLESKNDLINRFWAGLDTKTTGKVDGSKLLNKNALDADELADLDRNLAIGVLVDQYITQKGYTAPSGVDARRWKDSVKTGLMNKVIEQNLKYDPTNRTDFDAKVNEILNTEGERIVKVATADYLKASLIKEAQTIVDEKLEEYKEYSLADDKQINNVLERYIKSLKNTQNVEDLPTVDQIKNAIDCLIQDYLSTANYPGYQLSNGGTASQSATGNAFIDANGNQITDSVERLKKYGYNDNGKLNNLQIAVITDNLMKEIHNKLSTGADRELYEAYKTAIDEKIISFTKYEVANISASQFNSIDTNALVNKFMTNELKDIKAEYEVFLTARNELATYVGGLTDAKYQPALKKVFGVSSAASAVTVVNSYKDSKTVEEKDQAIRAEVKAINDAEEAEKAKKEEERKAALAGMRNSQTPFYLEGQTRSVASILSSTSPVEICLIGNESNLPKQATNAGNRLAGFLQSIANQLLIQPEYKEYKDDINNAMKTTINYYKALLSKVDEFNNDNSEMKTAVFSYQDAASGKTINTTASFGYRSDGSASDVNGISKIGYAGDSGLYIGCDQDSGWNGPDDYYIYVDLKIVLNKFLEFLNV